jgi:hypothetical protein
MDNPDHTEISRLANALGISAGARVAVVNEPDGWLEELAPLPPGARLFERASEPLDVIVYFSDERANVERRVPVFAGFLAPAGSLWSAVPDASEELSGTIVEDIGRACGLSPRGTVAIARGWTAMRLGRAEAQQSDATRG